MLDAYHLNKEETEIREAKQMNQPVVVQRLFILKETIEEEYLEQNVKTEKDVEPEELWGKTVLINYVASTFFPELGWIGIGWKLLWINW